MKTQLRFILTTLSIVAFVQTVAGQGNAFTYQGRLNDGANAANGIYDLRFAIYDALSGGAAQGSPLTNSTTSVSNGLFTVTLNFGAGVFNGADRWLEIGARTNGGGAFATLTPRQPITPTPYSIYAGGASASGLSGTIAGSQIAPGSIGSSHLSNTVSLWNRSGNNIYYTNGSVSIGTNVLHGASAGLFEIESGIANNPALRLSSAGPGHGSGLWLENRSGGVAKTWAMYAGSAGELHLGYQTTSSDVLYLGTNLNVGIGNSAPVSKLQVNGTITATAFSGNGSGLTGLPSLNGVNLFNGNQAITGGTLFADYGNANNGSILEPGIVFGSFGTVEGIASKRTAGGNQAGLDFYTAASPRLSIANGGNVGIGTTTPQKLLHLVSGTDPTIKLQSDGVDEISGRVSLRQSNDTGFDCYYDGNAAVDGLVLESFTGGTPTTKAMVVKLNGNVGIGTTNPGASLHVLGSGFFGDDSSALPASAGAGVRIFRDTATGVGHVYAYNYGTASATNLILQQPGGNVGIGTTTPTTKLQVAGEITTTAVNITSDRNAKERFKPVNARDVLAKVARLPISEWQYKEQSDARHIGPMAQDFHAAFAVGRDEKHITTVDADGVALAAIQGLNEKLEEQVRDKDTRIQELERAVAELKILVGRLPAPQNGGAR